MYPSHSDVKQRMCHCLHFQPYTKMLPNMHVCRPCQNPLKLHLGTLLCTLVTYFSFRHSRNGKHASFVGMATILNRDTIVQMSLAAVWSDQCEWMSVNHNCLSNNSRTPRHCLVYTRQCSLRVLSCRWHGGRQTAEHCLRLEVHIRCTKWSCLSH